MNTVNGYISEFASYNEEGDLIVHLTDNTFIKVPKDVLEHALLLELELSGENVLGYDGG